MFHTENLRKPHESYEVRHDNNGNAIHVIVKEGEAVIYPTLHDLVLHFYLEEPYIAERFTISEDELDGLYSHNVYNYYELKKLNQMVTKHEINTSGCEDIQEYYELILKARNDGDETTAKELFRALSKKQMHDFFDYVEESYFYSALDEGDTSEFVRLREYFREFTE